MKNCTNCSNAISSKAFSCPNCGHPNSTGSQLANSGLNFIGILWSLAIVSFTLLLIIGFFRAIFS